MSIKGNWDRRVSRRDFLAMIGMSTAALALSASGLPVLGDRALAQTTSSERLFTLGVASGDPLPNGVVLWTRLAPSPLNGGGMPSSNVKVRWEVAKDTDSGTFDSSTIVRSGTKLAGPSLAHSVHIEGPCCLSYRSPT